MNNILFLDFYSIVICVTPIELLCDSGRIT